MLETEAILCTTCHIPSPSTLAKMSNGEFVAMSVIARICEELDCKIEEVVEFIEQQPLDTAKER
ncbi:helix-turn-helix transcriptional regulator [Paenibacillus polymyxa]|nr:helix-turn-helix transcriptional regulator [Paenibacillus sp. EKM202P]KAF6571236.1 helix-turn-helix transcriptional regulator [Paenibacillus sp. EKM207P]KAF6617922.1 helix-turn-helix transcriptional regulator [Paenibacillus sp. EKM101P]KAF6619832.1 helix-turn-helix transcriptional regulator [Paenibacillus sp. EKM102P]KAF6628121.1 helix-turn-helix transcriptional regulator [Paenibacillus sp. EKM10P]KAF6646478.1 helix-turn-helix transcriptional regulator [Paenibacillus sp. EKM11P]MBY0024825.